MKRCRSDELQQPEEDPGAAGESPGHGVMEGKAGEATAAPEAGAVPPPARSKPPDLKVSGGSIPVGRGGTGKSRGIGGGFPVVAGMGRSQWGHRSDGTRGCHQPHPLGPTGVTLENAGWLLDRGAPGLG